MKNSFCSWPAAISPVSRLVAPMNKSERTSEGYREDLFRKFHVQSRVGLVPEAIRRDLVKL